MKTQSDYSWGMKKANILYISIKMFTIAGVSQGFGGEMNGSFQVTENLMSDPPFFLHEIIHLCLGLFFFRKRIKIIWTQEFDFLKKLTINPLYLKSI